METIKQKTPKVKKSILKAKRGAIKANASTSEPVVDASGDFSIFVIVENPYDVPITLYSVQTHIPVQLIDSIWHQRNYESQKSNWINELGKQKGWKKVLFWMRHTLRDFFIRISKPSSPRIAEAVGTETTNISGSSFGEVSVGEIQISGDMKENSNLVVGSSNEIWDLNFPENPSNDELDRIFMKIDDYKSGKTPVILQPGNAVVKQFILRAREKLFFSPIAYKFQIQLRYAVDGEENLDTVPFNLQIRATLTSIVSGSMFGSVLGTIARALGQAGANLSIGVFTLSIIFAAIAVIAFARKESAQTIISIEDFWGGILIGFLIGYLGEGYFRTIIGL